MDKYKKLGQRVVSSAIALVSRTFFLNLINFIGALALTIFLTPGEFGVFIIASAIVDILTYFSDVGLAGALIQKKKKLKAEEIEAAFTIQQLLVIASIAIILIISKPIQHFYNLGPLGLWLLYALLISFFLSSLKTIPSVLCERKLKFNKIVIPQIIEAFVFNILLVVLAWQGWGIKSFIVAALARAFSGTIAIYILVPWRPKLRFSLQSVKQLLHFGIPYQANSLISVFKDKFSLLILGKIIGLEGIGILGWAEKWANLPLRYFLDAPVKIAFPLFSRLQDNLEKAKTTLEQALFFIASLVFPLLAGVYLIMPILINVIPKYTKWQPGLLTFNLFLISAAIAAISTFLTNFLTAMGRVKQVLFLMIMWTSLTLISYPLLAIKFGYEGVAFGSILVALTSVVPFILVRRVIKVNILGQLLPAIISTMAMLFVLKLTIPHLPETLTGILLITVLGAGIYGIMFLLISGEKLFNQIKIILSYVKK